MNKINLVLCIMATTFCSTVPAQKSLIKQIEVKENRFFYKPIANKYIRSSEIDFDNSAYMDIRFEGTDAIVIDVFALDEDKGGWVKSTSVHGNDFLANHKYVKLQNEAYVEEGALGSEGVNLNVVYKPSFILYSKEKGVYYHSYSLNNNSGWGAYTPGKEKNKDKTAAYELLKRYDQVFENEVNAYGRSAPQKKIKEILAKKDEGITSEWHKNNTGKLLFGNNITPGNMGVATAYKTKFAVDEPVMMSVFADKGFNKYIDASATDINKLENYNANGESLFSLNLSFSNGVKVSRNVYIKHPEGKYLTLYIHDVLFAKAKAKGAESNQWIKEKAGLDNLKEEIKVQAELFTAGNEPYKIAEGAFSFIPKPGAVMPYGKSCSPGDDIKIANLSKIKPALTAAFKKALAAKPGTAKYQLTEFAIRSNWQTETSVPYPYIEVNFVVKNAKGECFSGADKYVWFEPKMAAEQAGYFIRAESKAGNIPDILYPYCDCGK